jgi:hypothetical protein
MSQKVILSRPHRDALYGELLRSLGEFEELQSIGQESDRKWVEASERIGRRMADVLRLIQDGGIGWGYPDGQDTYQLTLPLDELRRIIEAQRITFAAAEESERPEREESQRQWRQTKEAREACSSVLDQLGGR